MTTEKDSEKRVGVRPSYNGTGISYREKRCLSPSPERKDEKGHFIERERRDPFETDNSQLFCCVRKHVLCLYNSKFQKKEEVLSC